MNDNRPTIRIADKDYPPTIVDAIGANYLVEGIDRARTEWAWMGPLFHWSLLPSPGEEGYSLLSGAGSARQAFVTLSAFGASQAMTTAPVGFTPMSSRTRRSR